MMKDSYDTVVVGGTPGGIATAVRAAREGALTLLVTYNDHLGGMMTGGLSYTDTMMLKDRAPIFGEWRAAVREHYASTYGRDSETYARCEDGYIAEPHVGEAIFDSLVGDADGLEVAWRWYPTGVDRADRRLNAVTLQSFDDDQERTVRADSFVDATYEGDLVATAGVAYRIGRESRREYGEQFAGQLYTRTRGDRYYPQEAVGEGVDPSASPDRRGPLDTPPWKHQGTLDLLPHPAGISDIHPRSTGEGDDRIQAYNYRLCLTNDPANRRRPSEPAGYDRSEYEETLEEVTRVGFRGTLRLRYLPNDKADMNAADLPGANYDYPEADWERREAIADRHLSYAVGLLYFLQNDDAVPADVQEAAREWGIATDEWVDNDNLPFQLYIREARRLEGRSTFTENDARHAPGLDRTPVHDDGIAVAEYPLDSHACTADRQCGSHPEGHFFASQVTRPAHVPYGALLPRRVDNLLVPVPLSATHVGYGSIRLEPTWLHIGEAAGYAVAMAKETGVTPADVDVHRLQRRLAAEGVMLSFFNDSDVTDGAPWTEALQYLATKGWFDSFDARPEAPLERGVARQWARITAALAVGTTVEDPTERARRVGNAEDATPVQCDEFVELLREELGRRGVTDADVSGATERLEARRVGPIRRGIACAIAYDVLE